MSQVDTNFFSIGTRAPEAVRVLQNTLFLLKQNGPLLPQVSEEWRFFLTTAHATDDRALLMFLVESITLGLKLYQHPEIGVSLLTPNEANSNDEEKDQG